MKVLIVEIVELQKSCCANIQLQSLSFWATGWTTGPRWVAPQIPSQLLILNTELRCWMILSLCCSVLKCRMNSFIHITVISGSDWCTVQFLRVISNCDGVYGVQVSADSAFFD